MAQTRVANSRRDKIEKNRHSMKVSYAGFQRRERECDAKWPHIESNPCFLAAQTDSRV